MCNNKTAVTWAKKCRKECQYYFEANQTKIGGAGKIVEIDESFFSNRKYNRGRYHANGQWVFGGIERGTNRCFAMTIGDKTRATLEHAIIDNISPGTHIMTDGLASYNGIANIPGFNYTHYVVIHKTNFVDPNNNEIHTQNIEYMWSHMKQKKKQENIWHRRSKFAISYIQILLEEKYEKSAQENLFSKFIITLKKKYM